ncbi:MAG: amino acid hydroxylase [Actinomycetota bacterium]|nr:amino acid hydroxylase [Actinomycetota bacterium]
MAVCPEIRAERERLCRAYRPGQPLPHFGYSSDEDALWSRLFATLRDMHVQFACTRYQAAARRVPLSADRVPQLSDVSHALRSQTGFRLAPAMGALPGTLFYGPLADGILNASPDVRPVADESYSPQPDVIHELVGHAVMLADPDFADLYRGFGRAAKESRSAEMSAAIARLFWFTMEVGLIAEDGHPRACGAAILSSVTAMRSFADAELRDFRIEDVLATEIDDSARQPVLFVIDSVDRMMDEVRQFLTTSVAS